jgi:hypothetical protein
VLRVCGVKTIHMVSTPVRMDRAGARRRGRRWEADRRDGGRSSAAPTGRMACAQRRAER